MNSQKIQLIVKACEYINQQDQLPSLDDVAKHVGLSASHFHREFSHVLGISPRSFADANRQKHFRKALRNGDDITGALYAVGYGSSSRVYEFTHHYLGMTPRAYQQGAKNQTIFYNIVHCPLGEILIAATKKGICSVQIGPSSAKLQRDLKKEFPLATLMKSNQQLNAWIQALIDYLSGEKPWPLLPYDVKATAFQRKVWDWLRTIPEGQTYNYQHVAEAIGRPKAARAVARACANNHVALVIPCHRIVPQSGGTGGYRWGPNRKKHILKLESKTSIQ